MPPKRQPDSNGNVIFPPMENGFNDSVSEKVENGFNDSVSEKAVHKLIQEPLLRGIDDHLFEFSEAMRTVAKALRQVAEGKASAQAEAAEWKRKYELERERNLKLETKDKEHYNQLDADMQSEDCELQSNEAVEQSDLCCGKNDICSHEVLRDGETDSNFNIAQNRLKRKASFKLSWCCKGDKYDRHKHDIVSFEKGNITTAERSSKQISLKWESPPKTAYFDQTKFCSCSDPVFRDGQVVERTKKP